MGIRKSCISEQLKKAEKYAEIKRLFPLVTASAVMILIWNVLNYASGSPAIPPLTNVADAVRKLPFNEKFTEHLLSTSAILLKGILTGAVSGFVLGVICDISGTAKATITSVVHFIRGIPAIALFPLILAILGIGDESRIAVIIWTAFPPVFISTVFGMDSVNDDVIGAASLDGAGKTRIAIQIKIPVAVGEILNGLKIAIGTGFISVVTAEMLGANKGIGYMILWSTNAFKYSEVYAYIFVVAAMGFVLSAVIERMTKIIEKRIF